MVPWPIELIGPNRGTNPPGTEFEESQSDRVCGVLNGGAEGDRTPDLMTASHALSQLSYGPIRGTFLIGAFAVRAMIEEKMVGFKAGADLRAIVRD
jgi:hypothetical protein